MYVNRDKFNYFSTATINEKYWNDLLELGTKKVFKAETLIFEQNMIIHELACITSGTIKNVHFFDNGNEKLYEQLKAPALVGTEALWCRDGDSYYPSVISVTDVTAVVIPLEAVEKYASDKPGLVISLFQCIRNLMCIDRIRSVCSMPMSLLQKAAFAIFFMRRAEKDEDGYVPVTHEELAQLIGISRANVTTALAYLMDKKIIKKKRGKIKIIDEKELTKLLNNKV